MSAAHHTPGPWHIRDGYGLLKAEVGTADRAVAAVWTKQMPSGKEEQKQPTAWPEGEANARLIAAAPDLFQAAEQFIASVKDGNAADLIDYYADIFGEAVAKATGSTA